jgi:hypothetical protein
MNTSNKIVVDFKTEVFCIIQYIADQHMIHWTLGSMIPYPCQYAAHIFLVLFAFPLSITYHTKDELCVSNKICSRFKNA